jgi:Delta7-sterol 5-desaturase
MNFHGYLDLFLQRLQNNALRYLIIVLVAWLVFYKIFSKRPFVKKIQSRFQKSADYKREILHTVMTIAIFAAVPLILFTPYIQPHTTIYKSLDGHSLVIFFLMFPVMILIHDAYFYWMHRFMHWQPIYKFVHLLHHKSSNPGPFTTYSFAPLEAIGEVSIIIVFAFTIPIHPLNILGFLIFQTIHSVYIHMGYEIMPKSLNKHWLGKYYCTSINHNMHHQYYKGNYGLYFTWWDRWMGTLHPKYDETYEKTAGLLNRKIQEEAA